MTFKPLEPPKPRSYTDTSKIGTSIFHTGEITWVWNTSINEWTTKSLDYVSK